MHILRQEVMILITNILQSVCQTKARVVEGSPTLSLFMHSIP